MMIYSNIWNVAQKMVVFCLTFPHITISYNAFIQHFTISPWPKSQSCNRGQHRTGPSQKDQTKQSLKFDLFFPMSLYRNRKEQQGRVPKADRYALGMSFGVGTPSSQNLTWFYPRVFKIQPENQFLTSFFLTRNILWVKFFFLLRWWRLGDLRMRGEFGGGTCRP